MPWVMPWQRWSGHWAGGCFWLHCRQCWLPVLSIPWKPDDHDAAYILFWFSHHIQLNLFWTPACLTCMKGHWRNRVYLCPGWILKELDAPGSQARQRLLESKCDTFRRRCNFGNVSGLETEMEMKIHLDSHFFPWEKSPSRKSLGSHYV